LGDQAATISTHVLDVEAGRPARGVSVTLYFATGEGEQLVGGGTTDEDGRIRRLVEGPLEPVVARLEFVVDGPFFRLLAVSFRVDDPSRSYHVPLIVAPYSLATYRGS